jgi:hypothetical protein
MNFYSTVAGTIAVRLFNSAVNRIYYQEHTVAAGWNWLTATIPGDVSGTWLKDNGVGIYFDILLGGKETTPAVAAAGWGAGPAKAQTTNSTNLMATINNATIVCGFVVLPGSEAPPAARSPFIMRPYDQELLTCKRYLWRWNIRTGQWITTLMANGATSAVGFLTSFYPEMRAQPVVAFSAASDFSLMSSGGGVTTPGTSFGGFVPTVNSAVVQLNGSSGVVAGNATVLVATGAAPWFQFDARL